MTSNEVTRTLLAVAAALGVWLGVYRRVAAVPRTAPETRGSPTRSAQTVDLSVGTLGRNPLRADGGFPPTLAEPASVLGAAASAKPQLTLLAMAGGPPWRALVSGVPGASGSTVVDEGRPLPQLTIRRIARDTLWIAGFDTVWTLTLPRRQ